MPKPYIINTKIYCDYNKKHSYVIYSGSTSKAFFHTWLKRQSGRETQEVGSCKSNFISEELKSTATLLIQRADSCGGQNRSIKQVVMLLLKLLNHEKLT